MPYEMHQLFWILHTINHINFFGIYETFFIGFLTFISLLLVAILHRRGGLLDDLRRIKESSKPILIKIEEIEKDNQCPNILRVYEPALLEPRELENKLETNKCDPSLKDDRGEAERIILLLKILRTLENNIKILSEDFLGKVILKVIIPPLILLFVHGYLNPLVNFIIVVILLVFSVQILWWNLKDFFKKIDIFSTGSKL